MWRMDSFSRNARVGTPGLKMPPSHNLRERIKFRTQPVDYRTTQAKMDQLTRHARSGDPGCSAPTTRTGTGDTPGRSSRMLPSSDKELIFRGNASNMFRF